MNLKHLTFIKQNFTYRYLLLLFLNFYEDNLSMIVYSILKLLIKLKAFYQHLEKNNKIISKFQMLINNLNI